MEPLFSPTHADILLYPSAQLETPSYLCSMTSSAPPPRGSAYMAGMFGIPQAPLGAIDFQQYRAYSLNQPFRFVDAIKTGKIMLGTGLSIPSLPVARIQATLGFDFIFLDAEHTPMSPDLIHDIIKTCNYHSEGQSATIVRVPTHGHEWTAWALDAGASGIVFPHTDNAEMAKKAIYNCRFAPRGGRSFPPFATVPGHTDGAPEGKTMLDVYNEHAAIIMQIESREGVNNAEAICALPEVNGIMIGTADLRMDLGLAAGMMGPEPEFEDALQKIQAAANKYNKPILGFAMGEYMCKERLDRGWRLLMVSSDAVALVAGQTGPLKEIRGIVEGVELAKSQAAVKLNGA
ncbi:4-hydroxy-2-oxoheptanedioate aldolase, partial [Phenoliferia sp. Uapishka_3]